MIAKHDAGFRERSATRGTRQKLNAEFRFDACKLPTDDGLGDAEPTRGGRYATSIGDFHECPELFDIQFGVPRSATAAWHGGHYRITDYERQYLRRTTSPLAHAPYNPTSLTTAAEDIFMTFRNGLASLLRPEDSVLVLIDHQPFQMANLNSHEPQMVINNTVGLAKAAKAFGVPTILTTRAHRTWRCPVSTDHRCLPRTGGDRPDLDQHLARSEGGGRGEGDGPQATDHRRPVDRSLRRDADDPGPRRGLGRHCRHRRAPAACRSRPTRSRSSA